jgi:hypothetical protein
VNTVRSAWALGLIAALTQGAAVQAVAAPLEGAPSAPPEAVALVRRLYAHEHTPTYVAGLFARDLARAYRQDTSHPGDVGEIDFDWRFGAQDFQITELKIEPAPLQRGAMPMADRGEVRATFRNFGKPYEVLYRVCRAQSGAWRIADVSSDTGDDKWDLRAMLKLDRERVRC